MENNLNKVVRELCRAQGITMKELASRMEIAPESLSRAINGNPTLSTLNNIADKLNVNVAQLFDTSFSSSDLLAIILFRGKTHVINSPKELLDAAKHINNLIEEEFIKLGDI